MQKRHPEHIDDLEGFYRKQLEHLDVEPPAALWENISQRIPKAKPFYKTPSFLAGGAAAVALAVLTLLFVQGSKDKQKESDHKQEQHSTPKNDAPTSIDAPKKEHTEKLPVVSPTVKNNTTRRKNNIVVPATKDTASVAPQIVAEPVNTGISTDSKTQETTPDVKIEKKQEKKPKSFFEKHTNNYSDTTRQLFVPKK